MMTKNAKAQKAFAFTPDYAVAPGQTLSEVIESLHITQKELAQRTNLTEQSIVRILKGIQPISIETASRLEMATGVPARMWNSLEMQYREQLNIIKQKDELARDVDWLKGIPTRELISRGVIAETSDRVELLRNTLKFYGVASVEAWRDVWENPEVAARRSACFATALGPASAWIRLGELQTQRIECAPYEKQRFEKALQAIRKLTTLEPAELVKTMRQLCAEAGVALALVPEISKVPWNGATKWLAPDKAMILLNLRGKGEDIFWFSFFHEAHHVLVGGKKRIYVANNDSDDEDERKADRFAAETLIPSHYDPRIKASRSEAELRAIAQELHICPGIVAGRYRHLTQKWSFFKALTRSFIWKEKP